MVDEGTPTDPTRPRAPWTDTSWSDDHPLAAEPADAEPADAEPADAEPAAAGAPRASRAAMTAWSNLDKKSQLAVGAGLAVAAIGLIGTVVGAWSLSFSGVILIVAGLGAAAAAYMSGAGRAASATPIALRDLILAGGAIAAVLGVLFVVEIITDSDNLDSYGGVLGLIVTIALGLAGIGLYVAATRWWSGGPAVPWTAVIAPGGRATKLVLLGTVLVLIGWFGNVTIGFWFLEAGSEVITFILLAALVMRAAADPEQPLRLPLPAAFAALAFAAVGAIIAIQHTLALLDEGAGLDNWIAQWLYVVGVAIVVAGAVLGSTEGARTLTEGPSSATPQP